MKWIYFYGWTMVGIWVLLGCGESKTLTQEEIFLKAIRQNKITKIADFLQKNPELLHQKLSEKGLTPLHIACEKSKSETVKLLLAKGAKINEISQNGNTPLFFAVDNFMESRAIMQVLLENQAAIFLKNNQEQTVWDYIYQQKKGKFFQKETDLLTLLTRFNYLPDTTANANKKNILHDLSERCDSPEITEFLVEKHKLDPNKTDINGWTSLHYAAKGQNYEVARILLKNGANINAQTTRQVGKGNKGHWIYPEDSTPWDIYQKQTFSRLDKNMSPLFEKNGGKRSKDLGSE